jgi:hypothetical protein
MIAMSVLLYIFQPATSFFALSLCYLIVSTLHTNLTRKFKKELNSEKKAKGVATYLATSRKFYHLKRKFSFCYSLI